MVDEAGLVDLQTANVLVDLANEQAVGLALARAKLQKRHGRVLLEAWRGVTVAIDLGPADLTP